MPELSVFYAVNMKMDYDESDVAKVALLFQSLGATEEQSQVMSKQLLRRAAQLSEERQISMIDSTETLLKQVIRARQGLPPESASDLKP